MKLTANLDRVGIRGLFINTEIIAISKFQNYKQHGYNYKIK